MNRIKVCGFFTEFLSEEDMSEKSFVGFSESRIKPFRVVTSADISLNRNTSVLKLTV